MRFKLENAPADGLDQSAALWLALSIQQHHRNDLVDRPIRLRVGSASRGLANLLGESTEAFPQFFDRSSLPTPHIENDGARSVHDGLAHGIHPFNHQVPALQIC